MRFFSIYFTIVRARNIVRYIEDFAIWMFVKSTFHCTSSALRSFRPKAFARTYVEPLMTNNTLQHGEPTSPRCYFS